MYNLIFEEHAQLLKAISHPKRLEIINLLRDGEYTVSQIINMLDLPQANLSQHLQIMRQAKIVTTRRSGKEIFYKLSHPNILLASDSIRQLLIEKHKDDPMAKSLLEPMSELLPLTTDPVCKMRISPKLASYSTKHNNHDYYFCAEGCWNNFQREPNKYV
jgi:ArsR family transcriptional regulator